MTTPIIQNPTFFYLFAPEIGPSLPLGSGGQIQVGLQSGGPYNVGLAQMRFSTYWVGGAAASLGGGSVGVLALPMLEFFKYGGIVLQPNVNYYAQCELYYGLPPIASGNISPASPETAFNLTTAYYNSLVNPVNPNA